MDPQSKRARNWIHLGERMKARERLLDKEEERLLEHFWNPRTQTIRHEVPGSVIYFLELSSLDKAPTVVDENEVDKLLGRLVHKEYWKGLTVQFREHTG